MNVFSCHLIPDNIYHVQWIFPNIHSLSCAAHVNDVLVVTAGLWLVFMQCFFER